MKVITDKEILKIVELAITGDTIDCANQYRHFLEELGELITNHFGGHCATVSEPLCSKGSEDETSWCLHFMHDDCVPEDGGVYVQFDTDVSVEEWIREEN